MRPHPSSGRSFAAASPSPEPEPAPEKETELAIRALARRNASAAQKGEPRAYLVIAGDGPARSALELVAEADKATHETVIFLGAVNNAALPSLDHPALYPQYMDFFSQF